MSKSLRRRSRSIRREVRDYRSRNNFVLSFTNWFPSIGRGFKLRYANLSIRTAVLCSLNKLVWSQRVPRGTSQMQSAKNLLTRRCHVQGPEGSAEVRAGTQQSHLRCCPAASHG